MVLSDVFNINLFFLNPLNLILGKGFGASYGGEWHRVPGLQVQVRPHQGRVHALHMQPGDENNLNLMKKSNSNKNY